MNRRDFLRTAGGAAGGASAAAVGAGTAAAQEHGGGGGGGGGGNVRPKWPSYVSDAKGGEYKDLRGQSEVSIEVGVGSSGFAFLPTKIWVDPGTTIQWEFVTPSHNVKPNSQPEGGSLEGTEGGTFATVPEGETYSATLDTAGMYTYFCGPHEGQGMKGAIAVGDEVETEQVGGGGQTPLNPEHMGVPFHPHYVGVSTIVMMVVSLLFTFFLLKYGESPNAKGRNN
ncbi:plastocyanin/azurin family copper-binding protein [Halosimplex aquaticum]|uniref:Plastocyanin/azurin family copper-binding protein n=1 Tax=Halosimplex aquaticum TaxID=3026162 RepID=A0ABD5Y508_9EURY|nr:plastocyanin/azurin family copper-binding protein [Halosimplex aquaticum]